MATKRAKTTRRAGVPKSARSRSTVVAAAVSRHSPRRRAPQPTKAITVRLSPELQRRLLFLRGVLKRPVNKMINEAVEGFVQKRTADVQADLKALLAQIEEYKRGDPKLDQAFREWENAESRVGHDDPAEGVKVTTRVRELLNR